MRIAHLRHCSVSRGADRLGRTSRAVVAALNPDEGGSGRHGHLRALWLRRATDFLQGLVLQVRAALQGGGRAPKADIGPEPTRQDLGGRSICAPARLRRDDDANRE